MELSRAVLESRAASGMARWWRSWPSCHHAARGLAATRLGAPSVTLGTRLVNSRSKKGLRLNKALLLLRNSSSSSSSRQRKLLTGRHPIMVSRHKLRCTAELRCLARRQTRHERLALRSKQHRRNRPRAQPCRGLLLLLLLRRGVSERQLHMCSLQVSAQ